MKTQQPDSSADDSRILISGGEVNRTGNADRLWKMRALRDPGGCPERAFLCTGDRAAASQRELTTISKPGDIFQTAAFTLLPTPSQ